MNYDLLDRPKTNQAPSSDARKKESPSHGRQSKRGLGRTQDLEIVRRITTRADSHTRPSVWDAAILVGFRIHMPYNLGSLKLLYLDSSVRKFLASLGIESLFDQRRHEWAHSFVVSLLRFIPVHKECLYRFIMRRLFVDGNRSMALPYNYFNLLDLRARRFTTSSYRFSISRSYCKVANPEHSSYQENVSTKRYVPVCLNFVREAAAIHQHCRAA